MSQIIKVNEEDFDARVLKSDVPVIVHIGASWCPPCRDLTSSLEKVAREYAGRVAVIEVDSDRNPDLASKYGAGRIPNLLTFWEGRVVRREVGAPPYASLCQMTDELLRSVLAQAVIGPCHND